MKKSDLQSGMVVSLRDWKEKFILIGDIFCNATGKDFLLLDSYYDDLKHNYNDNLDIVEIYKCEYPNLMSCFLGNKLELVWKREEVEKEVTFEEMDNAASKFCEENRSYECKNKGCGPCAVRFICTNYNITRK